MHQVTVGFDAGILQSLLVSALAIEYPANRLRRHQQPDAPMASGNESTNGISCACGTVFAYCGNAQIR